MQLFYSYIYNYITNILKKNTYLFKQICLQIYILFLKVDLYFFHIIIQDNMTIYLKYVANIFYDSKE